ncbi:MAG TPA: protein kinase [Gemmatimonadales bacterium]
MPENERRERLEALFDEALALPPTEREAYLKRATDDAELRSQVLSLLGAADRPGPLDRLASVSSPDPLPRLQAVLADHYTVERELGRGGMAIVYFAQDLKHRRPVAIKVLRPELAVHIGTQRFLREIETAAGLSHPHILPLHDSGAADGLFWYVMPYVEGDSLRDRLTRESQIPLEEAIQIAREVAGALSHAHSHGVIHRDIKPENILCSGGGALVADFGIARAVDASGTARITETGMAVGTPAYMSPEQARAGRVIDARSDIYSLGCVVYEMLGGQPPFTGPTPQAVLARHTLDPVPSLRTLRPTVPVALEDVIERALAKMPADRFTTAHEFSQALERSLRGPAGPPRRTRRVAIGTAIVAIAVVLTVLGLRGVWRGGREQGRVAVLYFDDLSPDSAATYVADGLTEEIIARLGGVSRLVVQSRTAVKRFRGNTADPAEIGRVLRVSYLVNGSVQLIGSRVRVSVELANAMNGARVWGRSFDGAATDILSMEDSIAQAVAEGVVGGLAPAERRALTTSVTRNSEAYDHYLRGNFYLNRRAGVADGRRALDEYEAALRLDPGFAEVHGRVGLVYGIYANWPWPYPGLTTDSLVARGLAAADRALALDSSVVDGWLARGFLLIPHPPQDESQIGFRLDPTFFQGVISLVCPVGVPDCVRESIDLLAHASRLAPRDAEVWYQYGRALDVRYLFGQGPVAAGDSALRHALALDPTRTTTVWLLSLSYLRQRRYREAEAMIDSAMTLGRHDLRDFALRLHTRLAQGDGPGTRRDLDTVTAMLRPLTTVPTAAAYGTTMQIIVDLRLGDSSAARRRLAALDRRFGVTTTQSRLVLLCLAAAHAALGGAERERGLALLDRIPDLRREALIAPVWDPPIQ